MNEAVIGILLHLLNLTSTRKALRLELDTLLAPFTDLHFSLTGEEETNRYGSYFIGHFLECTFSDHYERMFLCLVRNWGKHGCSAVNMQLLLPSDLGPVSYPFAPIFPTIKPIKQNGSVALMLLCPFGPSWIFSAQNVRRWRSGWISQFQLFIYMLVCIMT